MSNQRQSDIAKLQETSSRNAHLMTIKVKVYVHAGSVHEAGVNVNFIFTHKHRTRPYEQVPFKEVK